MTSNHVAILSPIDGSAGLLDDTGEIHVLVSPAGAESGPIAACAYLSRFPDSTAVAADSAQQAISAFEEQRDRSLALDLALLLFDGTVSSRTRFDAAHELDALLASSGRREYVLDIMLAAPLPNNADPDGATAVVAKETRARSLVATVIDCQGRAAKAQSAWLATRGHPMVRQSGVENVFAALIHFGVFRRLVEEGKSQRDIVGLKGHIVLNQELVKRFSARAILPFISEYASTLPPGLQLAKQSQQSEDVEFDFDISESAYLEDKNDIGRIKADIKREQAESQVEKIAQLFINCADTTANGMLDELIESQTANTDVHTYVVKSLCNIATKCTIGGRQDVSLACLDRAAQFKNGIDSVLYIQIGNALRELARYDEAVACYERAIELDYHGDKRASIELEIIRVVVAKGDYERAEQSFLRLPDLNCDASALSSLGTLYRKMGRIFDAREEYRKAITIDSQYHVAFAGRAEADKQSGRYYRAISRYQSVLRSFSDLDAGSSKIYLLAMSRLYRLTRQVDKATAILTDLSSKYRQDCDVHLQLAKVYMLSGKTALAKKHFQQAQGPSLDKVAAQLFLTAVGQTNGDRANVRANSLQSDYVLPELQGLANCNNAINMLRLRSFEAARDATINVKYVDRLHADFGAVLGYHARMSLEPQFNYKRDHKLCRIAKRGHKVLRNTVHAIAAGNFGAATELEDEMCLLIA